MSLILKEILDGCQAVDQQAIETLVRRFWDWAVDQARAFTRDDDLAQDAAQEAFITALERLSDLRNEQAFPGWFRQIVRTQACRIVRHLHHESSL